MKDRLNFYINGKWVESDSNERIEIIRSRNLAVQKILGL